MISTILRACIASAIVNYLSVLHPRGYRLAQDPRVCVSTIDGALELNWRNAGHDIEVWISDDEVRIFWMDAFAGGKNVALYNDVPLDMNVLRERWLWLLNTDVPVLEAS